MPSWFDMLEIPVVAVSLNVTLMFPCVADCQLLTFERTT
jgi:hypothetical protein